MRQVDARYKFGKWSLLIVCRERNGFFFCEWRVLSLLVELLMRSLKDTQVAFENVFKGKDSI